MTADWQSKTRVKINFTIMERFRKLIMNPGRASSFFKLVCLFIFVVNCPCPLFQSYLIAIHVYQNQFPQPRNNDIL